MGKRLQSQFSDVNARIIKKNKKSERETSSNKRKHTSEIGDQDEVPEKRVKFDLKTETEVQDEQCNTSCKIIAEDSVLKEVNVICDLFYSDESRSNFYERVNADVYYHIIDEICLEGLEGITIEAFWKRLYNALDPFPDVNNHLKKFIWANCILPNKNFKFFELPNPRGVLEIYNRYDYMNTDIGFVLELAYELPDIYAPKIINSPTVLGACSTLNERIDISDTVKNLTIVDAERYGTKLVIVADQNLRSYALCGEEVDPLIEFVNTEYCILERIGRSRKLGELTQGQMSITSSFKMDAKSIFHYKKQLSECNLVTKQTFVIKSVLMDTNKTGSLLHLRRFYTDIRSCQNYLSGQIINLLKIQPGYKLDSKRLKSMFPNNLVQINKLLKGQRLKSFIMRKIYPYRTFFPDAKPSEYARKHSKTEKTVMGYELVNPYINILAYRDTSDVEESIEEIDEECDKDEVDSEKISGQHIYNLDTLRNIYYHMHAAGDQGYTLTQLQNVTGYERLILRSALYKLISKGVIDFHKFDEGKQRRFMYKISCTDKPKDLPSTSQETKTEKLSDIKIMILKRQREALAKQAKEIIIEESNQITTDNFLKIDKPSISKCLYLIRKFEMEQKHLPIHHHQQNIILTKHYNINLSFIEWSIHYKFNIQELFTELEPNITTFLIKPNFDTFYVKKYNNKCLETIHILLRLTLGERKSAVTKTETPVTPLPDLSQKTQSESSSKLDYMGPNPVMVYREIDEKATMEIYTSTAPQKFRFESVYPQDDVRITSRVYERIQHILNLVNESMVIEEMSRLNSFISKEEAKGGYHKKIDRKSLMRIVKRLVADGYLKIYKLVLYNDVINKTTIFICHPSVNHTDDCIKTSCQQLKWKYFTSVVKKSLKPHMPAVQKTLQQKIGVSPFSQTDVMNSISEMKKLAKINSVELKSKLNPKIGRIYGAKPKFTRMRVMHEFLFYLIYNYTGLQNPLPREEIRPLFKSYRIELSDEDVEKLPDLYSKEISWKMFIPPLPAHTGWPEGWALMCDIILRLPISVLLRIHNCVYEDSELLEILNHPIKRYYLVKDLSDKVRRTVLFRRKYLFDAYDTINRLVFCGLVQFGPQKYKEKDQVFIYFNRQASLKNTVTSAPGYNEIEDKEYPHLSFYFNSQLEVDQYWTNLNHISFNTQLNSREEGKLVTLTFINTKPEIVSSIKCRTPNEALAHDNGTIPGDGKGACGLDSAMWSHLIRNWFWSNKGDSGQTYTGLTNETVSEIPSKGFVSFNALRSNSVTKFYLPTSNKFKSPKQIQLLAKKLFYRDKIRPSVGINKYTRTIKKRSKKIIKREYNDEIDRKILKKMNGRRVKWTQQEDEVIILFKFGDMLLNGIKGYKKQILSFSVLRDVLHRVFTYSKYKTSRSIQRRLKILEKSNYHGMENQVSNLLKLPPIRDTFLLLLNKIGTKNPKTKEPFKLSEKQLASCFVILMSYFISNRKKVIDALQGNSVNNDHLCEENLKYTEETMFEVENNRQNKYEDPTNEDDIKKEVVKSVIHSSLSSKAKTNISSHLLQIYQNYSDNLLKEAVKDLRNSNMITYKKLKDRKLKIWDNPFGLSQYYVFYQYSTFNNVSALEAYKAFKNISTTRPANIDCSQNSVLDKRYGQLLGINEIWTLHRIEFIIHFPMNIVTLNPQIDNHDELVNEIALRYQMKLKMLQESNETEIDYEPDGSTDKGKDQDQEVLANDEKQQSESSEQDKIMQETNTLDSSNIDSTTINRLKTWIKDCIQTENERRSPSPEFMIEEIDKSHEKDNYRDTFPVFKESNNEVNKVGTVGPIPTLEQIKEGLLIPITEEQNRTIPHITELSDLLNKNFPDIKTDTETLLSLKEHFVNEYATLEQVITHENIDELHDSVMIKKLWERIENDIHVKDFLTLPNFEILIRELGGNEEDIELAKELMDYAEEKKFLGASAVEVKKLFLHRQVNCSLINLLKILIEAGLLLQTGINTLCFIHYKYQYAWVLQANTEYRQCNERLINTIGIKMSPWVRVDGNLDKAILKIWLSNVLSYTLDYPRVLFKKICDKFCYLKSVDLFYLIQILEELNCVHLFIFENQKNNLFSDWKMPVQRQATFLDNLEEIIVQPNNRAMTQLGSFFYEQ